MSRDLGTPGPLAAGQIQRNLESRGRWDLFAPHRREVTAQLTCGQDAATGRLCVLGAGNCNDLDLAALLAAFREVHLVDLDGNALAAGATQVEGRPELFLHGGADVAGVLPLLEQLSPQTPADDPQIDECLRQAAAFEGPSLPSPFESVASVCLLSQLIESVAKTLGESHPRFWDLCQAIRLRHLRLLADLAAPGGWGALITDFVSSVTVPDLATIPPPALPARLRQLVAERNFFHGLNPFVLEEMFRTHPALAPEVCQVSLAAPWRWDFGPRSYAVAAVRFQKRR